MGCTEAELPYTTIVAFDEKGATLHYETKRTVRNGRVLLLDAGAQVRRYPCDITRTTPAPVADARFVELVRRVAALEQDLARASTPGRPYLDVHFDAHRGVAGILADLGLGRVSAEEALAKGYTHDDTAELVDYFEDICSPSCSCCTIDGSALFWVKNLDDAGGSDIDRLQVRVIDTGGN